MTYNIRFLNIRKNSKDTLACDDGQRTRTKKLLMFLTILLFLVFVTNPKTTEIIRSPMLVLSKVVIAR